MEDTYIFRVEKLKISYFLFTPALYTYPIKNHLPSTLWINDLYQYSLQIGRRIFHSTILHMIFLLSMRRLISWSFWSREEDWKKILSIPVWWWCWHNIFFQSSTHACFWHNKKPQGRQLKLSFFRSTKNVVVLIPTIVLNQKKFFKQIFHFWDQTKVFVFNFHFLMVIVVWI